MRSRVLIGGLVVVSALSCSAGRAGQAGALSVPCTRTARATGTVSWQLRQLSGLTTAPNAPGLLYAHDDRGIRDSAAQGEDTTNASVWVIEPNGTPRAHFRLVDAGGVPIPYFDTEAISRDPQGRIVLADTGTNVDQRTVVALYRFTPPAVDPAAPLVSADVVAEVIPLAYYTKATTATPTKLNVEAFTIDATGAAWFIPRSSGKPYAYTASAAALTAAVGGTTPAKAIRSSRLTVAGPVTDASMSPDGNTLVVKSIDVVYGYDLTGKPAATAVATALAGTPTCTMATATKAKDPGYGEAIVVANDGSFFTVAEGKKTALSGQSSTIWSFTV